MIRYFLQKPKLSSYQKWQLIAKILDSLEHDFQEAFPNEPPIFTQGYRESLFALVTQP